MGSIIDISVHYEMGEKMKKVYEFCVVLTVIQYNGVFVADDKEVEAMIGREITLAGVVFPLKAKMIKIIAEDASKYQGYIGGYNPMKLTDLKRDPANMIKSTMSFKEYLRTLSNANDFMILPSTPREICAFAAQYHRDWRQLDCLLNHFKIKGEPTIRLCRLMIFQHSVDLETLAIELQPVVDDDHIVFAAYRRGILFIKE